MPFTIKKKWYPLAMLAILGVITFSLPLDMLIGYLVGLIQCRFLNGALVRLDYQKYQMLENSFVFKCVQNRPDFQKLVDSQYAQSFCRESQSTYT